MKDGILEIGSGDTVVWGESKLDYAVRKANLVYRKNLDGTILVRKNRFGPTGIANEKELSCFKKKAKEFIKASRNKAEQDTETARNEKLADPAFLRRAVLDLAMLASDKPEFFDPLVLADAKKFRDYVLSNRERFQ